MEQIIYCLQEGQLIHHIYCPTAEETIAVCEAELAMLQGDKKIYVEVPFEQFERIFLYFDELDSIKQGAFTYRQAWHIAKSGNIRHLMINEYDRVFFEKEAIGMSTALAFAQSKWNGASREEALENAVMTGLAVIGEAFIAELIAAFELCANENRKLQAEDGAADARRNRIKTIVNRVAEKAAKKVMYSSFIEKKTTAILHADIVTGALITGGMSGADITRIIKGQMSPAELFKSVPKSAASIVGSIIGLLIGGGIGLQIPDVSTAVISLIGGITGLVLGSMLAAKIVKRAVNFLMKDDTAKMLEVFNEQLAVAAEDFLLNEQELRQALSIFKERYDMLKELRAMHAAKDRKAYANSLIGDELIRIVRSRLYLQMPTNGELYQAIERLQ